MRWKDFSPFIRPMYLKCVFEFFLEILTLFLRKNLFRDAYINFSNNKFDLYELLIMKSSYETLLDFSNFEWIETLWNPILSLEKFWLLLKIV